MKTFQLTLTAMLLLGLTTAAIAQNRIYTAEEANIINITTRQIELNIQKQIMLESILGGNGLILTAWGLEADVRTGMGISEEQNRKIREKMRMIDEYHFSPIHRMIPISKHYVRSYASHVEQCMMSLRPILPT